MQLVERSTQIKEIIVSVEKSQKTARYEDGLKDLQFFWDYQNPEQPPQTEGWSEYEVAELLLACGILYGFYGLILKNAQETSKNFLTVAYDRFVVLGIKEKQLICSNYLALSYWRMGAVDEAEIWLENSLCFELPNINKNRLHTYIVESLIKLSGNHYIDVIQRLNTEESNFENIGDSYLRGLFYMNRGIAQKNISNFEQSLKDQLLARDIFEESGHWQLLSYAENNLACFYRLLKNLDEAFKCAIRALGMAAKSSDIRQKGGVYDTLALLALDYGTYEVALAYAKKAIAELEKTECYNYLVEYYETKIRVLMKLGRLAQALEAFGEASAIANQYCPQNVRQRLVKTLESEISEKHLIKIYPEGNPIAVRDFADLEFEEFKPTNLLFCVQFFSNRYISSGLFAGDLAVIERVTADSNNLVAVLNKSDDSVYFGYADLFMNMIRLENERDDPNPLIFSDNVGEILGKVIGVCRSEPDEHGVLKVSRFEAIADLKANNQKIENQNGKSEIK